MPCNNGLANVTDVVMKIDFQQIEHIMFYCVLLLRDIHFRNEAGEHRDLNFETAQHNS